MQVSLAIVRLVIAILLASAGNVVQACTTWEDEESMWNQEGCTLAELSEQIGPEIEYIPTSEAFRLCDVLITQQDVSASLPYVNNNPGIYCVAEDLEVSVDLRGPGPLPLPPRSAIQIQSARTSPWFLGHELRNTNMTTNVHDCGYGVGVSYAAADVSISHGQIAGFNVGITNTGSTKIHDMVFFLKL